MRLAAVLSSNQLRGQICYTFRRAIHRPFRCGADRSASFASSEKHMGGPAGGGDSSGSRLEEPVTHGMCRHSGGRCRNTDAAVSARMRPLGKCKKVKEIPNGRGCMIWHLKCTHHESCDLRMTLRGERSKGMESLRGCRYELRTLFLCRGTRCSRRRNR